MVLLEKNYQQEKYEQYIYSLWEKAGYFNPDCISNLKLKIKNLKHFSIIMPPPNANASLHMGHAIFVFLEDIMTRWARLKGFITLWLPGTDHAGIATQVAFEKKLAQQGLTRFDLGRDEFLKQCMIFTLENKKNIEQQLKILGASCDWSRNSFTLDPKFLKPVYTIFKKLYDDGLIYRENRMVNWCSRCQTVLSDLEIKYKKEKSKLYYIRYPLKDDLKSFISVATTRPETMLGDTAIAVNPKDRRYKKMIGKTVILPLVNREIPIITDELVKKDFGTGAVKVTPSHDPVDYQIAKKHNLPLVQIINFEGVISAKGKQFARLKKDEARQKIIETLRNQNLLIKTEEYNNNIAHCERCNEIIEPMISKQWFIKMQPLAKKAIQALKNKQTKIIPKRFNKIMFQWLKNIQDWCISRQLWWGQQIPVYYCGSAQLSKLQKLMNKIKETRGCGKLFVSIDKPKICPFCGDKNNIIQDPDTLDTWFSSGQWPFNTLGWIDNAPDFQSFYPTTVMETGYDILFFWVARMMMLGIYATSKVPFKYVYLHGLIRDEKGEKMSKSKGNVVDPLSMVKKYGADALRIGLISKTAPGGDSHISEQKIIGTRNLINKIWNIGRFILSNPYANQIIKNIVFNKTDYLKQQNNNFDLASHWILSEFEKLKLDLQKHLANFSFGVAFDKINNFIWSNFADWYVEIMKIDDDLKPLRIQIGTQIFYEFLIWTHPFMPFLTEALYSEMKNIAGIKDENDLLLIKNPPPVRKKLIKDDWTKNFQKIQKVVQFTRNIHNIYSIRTPVKLFIVEKNNILKINKHIIKSFINDKIIFKKPSSKYKTITKKIDNITLYYNLEGAIDFQKEKTRLKNELLNLENQIKTKKALISNKEFIKKAPKQLVKSEKEKLKLLKNTYKQNKTFLDMLKKMSS